MQPQFNVWLEVNGQVVLSAWRVALLEAIAATGSISAAAKQLNIPYRRAWEKLKEMEAGWGAPLVTTATGGKNGGGAMLTPAGEQAIAQFRQFAVGLEAVVQRRYQQVFQTSRKKIRH